MTFPSKVELRWPRLLFIVTGTFAVACIGFLLAVAWENSKAPSAPVPQQLSVEQKSQVLNSLNSSSSASMESTTSAGATGPSGVSASQAGPGDTDAAAKLRILDSLNGSN